MTRIDSIKERLSKITKWPWEVFKSSSTTSHLEGKTLKYIGLTEGINHASHADFIVNSPKDLSDLIEAYECLREALDIAKFNLNLLKKGECIGGLERHYGDNCSYCTAVFSFREVSEALTKADKILTKEK